MILGSGLGQLVERMEDATAIDYCDVPHFPAPTVAGHAGRMVFGRIAQERIQLNEEVTVTLTHEIDLGLFAGFGSFPITLRADATGKSEVYWK